MAQQVINVGTIANDGTGDKLRDAMVKVNDNFTDLYGNVAFTSNLTAYQTTAGLSANVATLTANDTSFVGGVSAANVVSNAQLTSNLANYQTTAGLSSNVATLTSNNSTYAFGKSEANLNVNSAVFATNANYANLAANATSAAQLDGVNANNYVRVSGDYSINGVHTHTANIVIANADLIFSNAGISANGSYGTSGQVLTSNGSKTYWSTPSAGSGAGVNTDFAYVWANVQTFNENIIVGETGNTILKVGNSSYATFMESNLDGTTGLDIGFQITNVSATYYSGSNFSDGGTIINQSLADLTDSGTEYQSETVVYGPNSSAGYSQFELSYYNLSSNSRINSLMSTNSSTSYGEYVYGYGAATNNFITFKASNTGAIISVGNSTINTVINSSSIDVKSIIANGGVGSDGQVLISNGSTTYWGAAAGVNTAAQYTWTNTQTFNANVNIGPTGNTQLQIGNSTFRNYLTSSLSSRTFYIGAESANTLGNYSSYLYVTDVNTYVQAYANSSDSTQLEGTFYVYGPNGSVGYAENKTKWSNSIITNHINFIANSSSGYGEFKFTNSAGVDNRIRLTSNVSGSYISVGNSTVNATINSTAFTGYVFNLKPDANGNINATSTATNAIKQTDAIVVGKGSAVGNIAPSLAGAMAIGSYSYSSGQESLAIGYSAFAENNYSTAIGPETSAPFPYSTAIGYGAATFAANQIMIGTQGSITSTLLNGNVGIGNTAPTNKLSVNGTTFFGDYVGIGRNASYPLDVANTAQVRIRPTNTSGSSYLLVQKGDNFYFGKNDSLGNDFSVEANANFILSEVGDILIAPAITESVRFSANGNFGIGNTAPKTKLQIGGNYGVVANSLAAGNNHNVNCAIGNYFIITCNSSAQNVYFTNAPANTVYSMTLRFANGNGGNTISWANTPKWPAATAPTPSTNNDIWVFITDDGGTTWRGNLVQKDSR